MKTKMSSRKLGKFLAYVLGRRPDEFGLALDREGFAPVKEVLKAVHEREGWRFVRASHINELLMAPGKAPIETRDGLIRASDRSGAPVHRPAENLPKLLRICVRRKGYAAARENGVRAGGGRPLVLSSDTGMAERIGKRRDASPVLLSAHVEKALEAGVVFTQAGENLFLCRFLPASCLDGPSLAKHLKRLGPPSQKQAAEEPTKKQEPKRPGSFFPDLSSPKARGRKTKPRKSKDVAWKKGIRKIRRKKNDFDI